MIVIVFSVIGIVIGITIGALAIGIGRAQRLWNAYQDDIEAEAYIDYFNERILEIKE